MDYWIQLFNDADRDVFRTSSTSRSGEPIGVVFVVQAFICRIENGNGVSHYDVFAYIAAARALLESRIAQSTSTRCCDSRRYWRTSSAGRRCGRLGAALPSLDGVATARSLQYRVQLLALA
jgi:hypothetical protein